MLYMVGGVMIEVVGFNITETDGSAEAGFAEKAVVGRRPVLEAVGEGPETLSLSGRLFPHKFGGLSEVEALQSQRQAQIAIPVLRGDGVPLGFFVITGLTQKHSKLDREGVGRVVDIEIKLKRSDLPSAGDVGSFLADLFGEETVSPTPSSASSAPRPTTPTGAAAAVPQPPVRPGAGATVFGGGDPRFVPTVGREL